MQPVLRLPVPVLLAGVVVLSMLGLLVAGALSWAERVLLRWR